MIVKKLELIVFYTTLESPIEIVLYAIKEFRKRKIIIICNAAPQVRTLPFKYLTQIDCLLINEFESTAITQIITTNFDTASKSALLLRDQGAHAVIITLGEKDAVLLKDGTTSPLYFPSKLIKVVDTTGAGDTFAAAFITKYLNVKNEEKAIEFGNIVGAYTCTRLGAYEAMPNMDHLEFVKFIYQHMGIKNLIFDYNGVISDDLSLVYENVLKVFAHFGVREISYTKFKKNFTYPLEDFYKIYLSNTPIEDINTFYFSHYGDFGKPTAFPNVKNILT